MVAFGAIVFIGTLVRVLMGTIVLVGMENLFNQWLHLSEWKFKMEMIGRAGIHQNRNLRLINVRGWIADGLTVGLAVEVVSLLLWLRHAL